MSPQQAGLCAFRKGSNWLRTSAPADFPRPDPTTGRFETAAVEAWVRRTYRSEWVGRAGGSNGTAHRSSPMPANKAEPGQGDEQQCQREQCDGNAFGPEAVGVTAGSRHLEGVESSEPVR